MYIYRYISIYINIYIDLIINVKGKGEILIYNHVYIQFYEVYFDGI